MKSFKSEEENFKLHAVFDRDPVMLKGGDDMMCVQNPSYDMDSRILNRRGL